MEQVAPLVEEPVVVEELESLPDVVGLEEPVAVDQNMVVEAEVDHSMVDLVVVGHYMEVDLVGHNMAGLVDRNKVGLEEVVVHSMVDLEVGRYMEVDHSKVDLEDHNMVDQVDHSKVVDLEVDLDLAYIIYDL